MYCRYCGTEINKEDVFCSKCGKKQIKGENRFKKNPEVIEGSNKTNRLPDVLQKVTCTLKTPKAMKVLGIAISLIALIIVVLFSVEHASMSGSEDLRTENLSEKMPTLNTANDDFIQVPVTYSLIGETLDNLRGDDYYSYIESTDDIMDFFIPKHLSGNQRLFLYTKNNGDKNTQVVVEDGIVVGFSETHYNVMSVGLPTKLKEASCVLSKNSDDCNGTACYKLENAYYVVRYNVLVPSANSLNDMVMLEYCVFEDLSQIDVEWNFEGDKKDLLTNVQNAPQAIYDNEINQSADIGLEMIDDNPQADIEIKDNSPLSTYVNRLGQGASSLKNTQTEKENYDDGCILLVENICFEHGDVNLDGELKYFIPEYTGDNSTIEVIEWQKEDLDVGYQSSEIDKIYEMLKEFYGEPDEYKSYLDDPDSDFSGRTQCVWWEEGYTVELYRRWTDNGATVDLYSIDWRYGDYME